MVPTVETYGFISRLLGSWSQETLHPASILLRIGFAFILSSLVGSERATKRHSAGLRTFILVAMGSVFAAMCDKYLMSSSRYSIPLISAASIISHAIISSNSILFSPKSQLKGLTTTVSLWATGIISLCIGFGLYDTATLGFIAMIFCVIFFPVLEKKLKNSSDVFEFHVELQSRNDLQGFTKALREFGLKIEEMEYNPTYANSGLGVYTLRVIREGELKRQSHDAILKSISALKSVEYVEEI